MEAAKEKRRSSGGAIKGPQVAIAPTGGCGGGGVCLAYPEEIVRGNMEMLGRIVNPAILTGAVSLGDTPARPIGPLDNVRVAVPDEPSFFS